METQSNEPTRCAHVGCNCPGIPQVASNDTHLFCSDACAEGKGCDHPGCNCGQQTAEDGS